MLKGLLGIAVIFLIFSTEASAGVVTTKDPKNDPGGYHDKGYHLKGRDKKPFVNRDDNWHNPFTGFTKGVVKDSGSKKKSSKTKSRKK